jgi:putative transcriptional regulator
MKFKAAKKKIKLFTDLKESLAEALAYERGEPVPLRVSELPPRPKPLTPRQIRAIRQSFNASQATFARIINVSLNAVESWEQGVRRPREATLKLLTIAHRHPEVLLAASNRWFGFSRK